MRRLGKMLPAALCFILLSGTYASGQNGRPCDGDIEYFCQNVQVYGGWTAKCLELHMARLTPACRALVSGLIIQAAAAVDAACDDDITSVCFGVKREEGLIVECLNANWHKLSPVCKATLYEAKPGMNPAMLAPEGPGAFLR
jgi:hypothetical protein